MARRALIFGGTFDPPHRAHVQLPPLAARELGCDRVIYVPAALNPLKTDHPPAPAEHRLAMLRLALQDVRAATIWTGELDRAVVEAGPSYTIDTIEALRRELGPGVELRLLIGADQALEFHRWKQWQRILDLAAPAVMLRPPWDRAAFEHALRETVGRAQVAWWINHIVNVPQVDISATDLRQRLHTGAALDELLPRAVAAYVRRHQLYADDD